MRVGEDVAGVAMTTMPTIHTYAIVFLECRSQCYLFYCVRAEYRLRLGETPMLLTCVTSRSWLGRVSPSTAAFAETAGAAAACNQNQYRGFMLSCSLRFLFIPQRLFLTVDYQPVTVASRTAESVSTRRLRCSPLHKSAANLRCISRPRPPGLTVRDCQRIWVSEGQSCD